jgi:hypothetical protein
MRNVSAKSCRKVQNTSFRSNNFFPKILPFMRKCGKKYGRARQVTDDNVIRKATETRPEYLIPIAF